MQVYLAYSENYHDILLEEKAKLIISYGRMHRYEAGYEVGLPEGFPEYLIDSGGFQIYRGTTERLVSLEGYTLYIDFILRKYGKLIRGYMALDNASPWDTLNFLKKMRSDGFSPIPVWKAGWPDEVLDYMCDTSEYVAIGGISGSRHSKASLRLIFERVKKLHPDTLLHLLGVGIKGMTAFRTFRPYSVDFSTWGAIARFGMDIVEDKKQGLKEVQLSKELRDRLRHDKTYERDLTREAIRKLLSIGDRVESLHEPHQVQMEF